MRRVLKLASFLAAALLLVFIVVSVAFYHLMRTGEFRRYLISEIEHNTDLKVQLGEADLEIGRILGISFRDVSLGTPGADPGFTAERVTARVALWPLLNRQLVFYEVRVKKPAARLTRDRQGKIPLLERLVNLPFLKQEATQFALDLRTVIIVEGEIDFTDLFAHAAPESTRFYNASLVMERMRGQALREVLEKWAGMKPKQPQGAALKFDLEAGVEREGQRAQWGMQGRLVFPGETLDLAQAWCDVETRIGGMPVNMAQAYGGNLFDVKSLGGALDSRLRVQGHLKQRLQVSGTIDFARLSVNAPDLFAAPVDAGDGQLSVDIFWQPKQWEISRLDYRSKDLVLAVQGQVRHAADKDTHLKVDLSVKPLPVAVIKKYLPGRWLASGYVDKLLGAVSDGELQLHKAGVNATVAEIRKLTKSGLDERFWFEAEIRNLHAQFLGGYPPLRAVQGRIALEKGNFVFRNIRGAYGQSRLASLDGSYDPSPEGPGVFRLQARGEADLGELREQGQRGNLPAPAAKALMSVQALGGKGHFDLTLRRPADGAARLDGKLMLENARLQWDKYSLTDINGELALTPTDIITEKTRALIHGSPLEMRLTLKNYAQDDGSFDLVLESSGVKAGVASRLLLQSGSFEDPGIVRGAVRYRGSFSAKESRKFTGNLELVNVQLATQPFMQPLRQLNGRIAIDESGIDFQDLKGLLVGLPARVSGRWRYSQKPQLTFDFAAPNLDITYLISQIHPETTDFYDTLHAEGRIALGRGLVRNFGFTDLKSNLVLNRRRWSFSNLSARAGGGSVSGPVTVLDRPGTLEITAEPIIQNVAIAEFLSWFHMATPEITGTVNLTGKFDAVGKDDAERKRSLNGAFNLKIADGTIHRLRILVQLLNVLDLSRWFTLKLPDLNKQGIRFRAITGDFMVARGVYATENLLVDSDDLRVSGAGKIDVPQDQIDFVVAVRPFAGIDAAITQIPLLGRGIAAIKNSFLVASFNIQGPIDQPAITPAPLGTLSEMLWGVLGIPKSLIPFIGDDKEAQQELPKKGAPSISR